MDDGTKLPPKAVFGIAATEVLGFQVLPKHFTGGIDSPCFKILEESGYVIKPKGGSTKTKKQKQQSDTSIPLDSEDVIWTEGKPRRVMHLRRERSSGLARAKKAEFKSKNGRLYCERCKLDPVDFYGPEVGEACRDLGRVGLLVLNKGKAFGEQVVPADFIEDMHAQPGDKNWPYESSEGLEPYYRSFWWGEGNDEHALSGLGIHGQTIWVAPGTGIVIALYSTWPRADGDGTTQFWGANDELMGALVARFR